MTFNTKLLDNDHLVWHKDGMGSKTGGTTYDMLKSKCTSRGRRLCYFKEVCPNGGPNKAPSGNPPAKGCTVTPNVAY